MKQAKKLHPSEISVDRNSSIFIKGARVHNLKNIDVSIPRNKLVVVTGVSGSGKSSLTIDTLFAEGQRRYAESLSAYARQFMQRMDKPDVDYISGLCPAIAIEQKVITRTPRSTVGSMTEIYDYLRLLFARVGKTISPISGEEVKKHDVGDVVDQIQRLKKGDKYLLLSKWNVQETRTPKEELQLTLQKGFSRLYFNGDTLSIEDILEGDSEFKQWKKKNADDWYLIIDRYVHKDYEEDDIHRISDSIQTAFYEGGGVMTLQVIDGKSYTFSNKFERDGILFDEPVPNMFSFNNPYGACPTCEGFSLVLGIDPMLVIPDRRLSVYDGAVAPWKGEKLGKWKDMFVRASKHTGFPIHKPVAELTDEQMNELWYGNDYAPGIHQFFQEVEQNLYKIQYRVLLSRYRGKTTCPDCEGYRLRKEALYVKVGGMHIGELCELPVKHLVTFFKELKLSANDQKIAQRILQEIDTRLRTLMDVGLEYLTLNRLANTLSGGESQRIQLTRSLGSNLTNSLYILDEPSIGLHPSDTERLIGVLKQLRDLGNTVVVVEHDEMMMREADYIIDMGPLASHLGGEVVAAGTAKELMKHPESLTGKYLSGKLKIEGSEKVRKWNKSVTIEGARQHNLKDIDVTFPLGVMCAVSGMSGSGKTTLVKGILYSALMKELTGISDRPGLHKKLSGDVKSITHVELVDQNPIGKSSRSNPVTYIKVYDLIRDLYSSQPMSVMRGFKPKHFSFNVDGGRCDTCKGEGVQVVEMQFLADVHLLCESCQGKRFKEEVLEVTFKGKNIHDVLELSVDEAIEFFASDKKSEDIGKRLQPLSDVGLGYVKLGQSSDTLSGGEAQRVKLASFLGKGKEAGSILFIFDEPTTGLHFHDIHKLLASFDALIEQGHSIIVIEHNTDVLKRADWIIDLGPGAGEDGGEVVYEGVPGEMKKSGRSKTAKFMNS